MVGHSLLVVDDETLFRRALADAFDADGYTVLEACDGAEALAVLRSTAISVMVTDLTMPIMDGVELLEMLKSKPELTAIPVIMLASPADHAVLPKIRALGVSAILMKPISEPTLLAAIQSAITLQPLKTT